MNSRGILIGSAVILGGILLYNSFKNTSQDNSASGGQGLTDGYLISDVGSGFGTANPYSTQAPVTNIYILPSGESVFPSYNQELGYASSNNTTNDTSKKGRTSNKIETIVKNNRLVSKETGNPYNTYDSSTGIYTDMFGRGSSISKDKIGKDVFDINNPLTKAVQSVQGKKTSALTGRSW